MKRSILILPVLAGAALAASAGVRERAWSPLVRLTGGSGAEAPKLAAVRLKDGAVTLGTVLNGLEADEETRAFFNKILENLQSFDLQSLYESLPEEDKGGYRAVGFTGTSDGKQYHVRQVPVAQSRELDPAKGLGSRFLDAGLGFRSKHANGDNFVGDVRASVGLGNASWLQVVGCLAQQLRLMESTAPGNQQQDPGRRPSKASLDEVKKDNPKLGAEDLELMGLFRESFPRLYEHLRELYRTDDVLVYDPDAEAYTQIHFVAAFRRDSQKHKAVIEWLEGLGPLMNVRGEFCDSQGRPLVTLRFNSKDLATTIDAFVYQGKLCPVDSGKVLIDEGVDLEQVVKSQRTDRWSFESDVNGIVTEIKDLMMKVTYESGEKGMRTRIVCDQEPKVRVHGSAFGVIPTWAIDVVIPGNMEELTKSFLKTVTRGNDGKGLVMEAGTRVGENGTNILDFGGEAEGLNNFLVRLGFKIARRKLIPPEEATDDLASYLRAGHAAITKDVEDFAASTK
ncbi:MAG TPA: hypothetical protein VFF73_33415 [Planctomycetota bacterium]|nr:hypothetical protein [Planctomycetota bacterium]